MQLLIVEDDDAVSTALADAVAAAGHTAECVTRGEDALLRHREADMILLDLGLPDMDGLEVLRKLRLVTTTPVVILSARNDERSVVRGLRQGADDYLVKPIGLTVLLARIEAVARRSRMSSPVSALLQVGELGIDLDKREARLGARALNLTAKEFDLLALLAKHAGSVVTREQILDALWGDAFVAVSRSLDVHLTGLRAKLERPGMIINVRGVGYRLEANLQ
ncbi:DNA-binding response regulator [Arthrobacter sp. MYb211]|uniref:response regulator transcription factor n=1 Tax=Micrococcaceae TaxID=1268 RepID=UPI000CFDD3DD|nr:MULTISPECIES: response regulator transcription factor [unclassified Arthrobacter]PRA01547.1 DNA-binding response regulator [Arthrobacter sp. MYb224]PRA07079.1 DNA-binding response regulator [Arthrobacter sp. MYb229]PRA14129.1 DNA-binding response regulator [Arthrobacter sp. MYb221]PRB53877.1 DNA-binding response regulator [Arthrobacter sp. MYb216]PRC09382.1 DNA-binding response regulator [Arthrobacter sp. MYb211]